MARCAYHYKSGDRCIYTGCKNEGDCCPAHNLLQGEAIEKATKQARARAHVAEHGIPNAIKRPARKRPKFGQPSRVQSVREIIDKLPPAPPEAAVVHHGGIGDPSAPWCTCRGRCKCSKPKWDNWRQIVAERMKA